MKFPSSDPRPHEISLINGSAPERDPPSPQFQHYLRLINFGEEGAQRLSATMNHG